MPLHRSRVAVASLALLSCLLAAPAGAEKVQITFGSLSDLDVWKKILAPFQAANPDIDLVIADMGWPGTEKKKTLAAAGQLPDVFYLYGLDLQDFGQAGLLEDLGPWIERNKIDLDQLFINPNLLGRVDGKIETFTYDVNGWSLVYNKDMFDDYGLALPTDQWTWDDLAQAAQRLTHDNNGDGKNDTFGFDNYRNGAQMDVHFIGFGTQVFDQQGDLQLDSPAASEAIQYWSTLQKQGFVAPDTWSNNGWFTDHNVGMELSGQSWWGRFADTLPFHWGVQYMPNNTDGPRETLGTTGDFAMSSQSKHPDAAFKLLNYLVSEQGQTLLMTERGGFPSTRQALQVWRDRFVSGNGNVPDNASLVLQLIQAGLPYSGTYLPKNAPAITNAVSKEWMQVISQKITPSQFVENATKAVAANLK